MLVILSENARVGRPLVHNREQCMFFTTILELESASEQEADEGSICKYSLGQRIFLDLYHALGRDAFQQGFHSLYLKRFSDEPRCEDAKLGICHLEAAFKAGASDEAAAKVDEIIGHWYYGRTASHEADREALVALYRDMGGSNWADSTNWLSDAHIGEWYGVSTNVGGRVIELNLARNGLSGQLSPRLGDLHNLRELLLSGNRLSGQIPEELGNLTDLARLELGYNQLSGQIPEALGNLTNLTRLELGYNQLSGAIPAELGSLTNLTRLDLSYNQLSGAIPASLGDLAAAARYLRLVSGNQFTGCIPDGLTAVADNDLAASGLPSCGGAVTRP